MATPLRYRYLLYYCHGRLYPSWYIASIFIILICDLIVSPFYVNLGLGLVVFFFHALPSMYAFQNCIFFSLLSPDQRCQVDYNKAWGIRRVLYCWLFPTKRNLREIISRFRFKSSARLFWKIPSMRSPRFVSRSSDENNSTFTSTLVRFVQLISFLCCRDRVRNWTAFFVRCLDAGNVPFTLIVLTKFRRL